MELPNAQHRQKYVDSVRAVEEDIKRATKDNDVSDVDLQFAQEQLDVLAKKYQNNKEIGSAKYKLYELQAFIHYFNHKDDKALEFINSAIDIKGDTYPKAEKLIDNLSSNPREKTPKQLDEPKLTKTEKRKKFIGLEGWLAWFIVGQFLAIIITVSRLFSGGLMLSYSDVNALNEYKVGLGDTLQTITGIENLMIFIYIALVIATLILLFRRRKLAKPFAIAMLVFVAIYGVLDYAATSSVVNSSGLSQFAGMQPILSKIAGDAGRNIFAAFIWVPYFLKSKRVKATLTK